LDNQNKRCKKNNSSRDEIYETKSRVNLDYNTNIETAKELNKTPVLDKIQEQRKYGAETGGGTGNVTDILNG